MRIVMAARSHLRPVVLTFFMWRSSAVGSLQCPDGEFKCEDGTCVLDEWFCNSKEPDFHVPSFVYIMFGIFGFLMFLGILLSCYRAYTRRGNVHEPPRIGFNPDVPYQTGRINPPESGPVLSNNPGTSSNYQSTGSTQWVYTCRGYERVNPKTKGHGTHGFQTSRQGPSRINQPATSRFGPSRINQPATSRFGPSRINQPATSRFGPSRINQPATSRFGPSRINQPATSRFGPSRINQPATSRFGSSRINQPATSRFGSSAINRPATSRFGSSRINQPATSRFGSSAINRPAMSRYR